MNAVNRVAAVVVTLVFLAGTSSHAGDLEDALEAHWRGAWVVTLTETFSGCDGVYTNNHVEGTLVSARDHSRFEQGELARVSKVNLKRSRVDLYLELAEPVLRPRQDGPFTLFDERACRLQMMVELPREVVKAGDPGRVNTILASALERHPSAELARLSGSWNRRQRQPYPADYELTLARHATWKAEQVNIAVQAQLDRAAEEARRSADGVRRDPDYLDGLAVGIEAARSWYAPGCDELVDLSFSSLEDGAPSDHRGSSDADRRWRQGFSDGQRLVYGLELLRRLPGCFVPIPPPPS